MDTNKLLELLNLLEADESEFSFVAKIDEVFDLISQNNEESNNNAAGKTNELYLVIKSSRAAIFAKTEIVLLQNISADKFFGLELVDSLYAIMNSRGYEVTHKLNAFRSQRNDKYKFLMQLRNSLVDAGIVSYKQSQDEIALSIPEDFTQVKETSTYLRDFGRFIESVEDCQNSEDVPLTPVKISRLNKSSADFFVLANSETVKAVLEILSELATVYLAIKELRAKRIDPALNQAEQTEIGAIYEKVGKRKVAEFVENIVEKISKNPDQEKRTKLRKYLKLIIKWLPLGIHLEVVYSKSVEPIVPEGQVQMTALEEKRSKQLGVMEMYKLPKEQLQLPEPDPVEPADAQEDDE